MPRSRQFPHHVVSSLIFSLLVPALLALGLATQAPLARAAKDFPVDGGISRQGYPALGINDTFGRWNGTVKLVYDPDGKPANLTNAEVVASLAEATKIWERVSGIRFELTGTDAAARDDSNSSTKDELVRVFWGEASGAAGLAGPDFTDYSTDVGYWLYGDGSVELSNVSGVIESQGELLSVLVHELGHLLGLGHSDNPDSVMYANPYNYLNYPRADDIRAVQVLYGAPAVAIAVDQPIAEWLYTVPPAASTTVTQNLFKRNAHPQSGSGAFFEVRDATVTSIATTTPNGAFVYLGGGIGNGGAAVNIAATLVVVDPFGYVYSRDSWTLTCSANFSCVSFSPSIAQTDVLKTIPGTWEVHVVDEVANRTLLTLPLPVTTTVSYNRPPTATLTVAPGSTATRAAFTLTATDPEGDRIEVVWRPPGLNDFDGDNRADTDTRNTFASGGSTTRSFNFARTGVHIFYVEVRDDSPRYVDAPGSSEAGEGFQTLMKVTLSLPASGAPVVDVVSTQVATSSVAGAPTQQVLAAVATSPATLLRARNSANGSDVAVSNGLFLYGASKDQGTTTSTSFKVGDTVNIAASVSPQAADSGKAADIFIVVRTTTPTSDTWTYRNSGGVFVPWPSVAIADLRPAASVSSMKSSEAFEVFSGKLLAAQHRIYVGYRLSGGTVLLYTGQALSLTVTN
ncbi:MAG: macrophage metalloelastase [Pseudomonadota bacterium]|jgi:hypothetical protein